MTPRDLREIADRVAIADVLVEYCRLLDRMDLGPLAALFTTDCVVDYGPAEGFASRGRAALRRDLERLWRYRRTAHHLSNVQVAFRGDAGATAHSAVLAWHEWPDLRTAILYGRYDDELVREDGRWRIARRRMTNVGGDPAFDALLHPHERLPAPPGWRWPRVS